MPPATHHSFARLTITPRPECTNHKSYESSVEDDGALDFFEFAEVYSCSSDSTSSWGDDAQDEDPTDMPLAVEIVDGKFGDKTAGCYRIVSSDDVVFYIPGKLLRQGPRFHFMATAIAMPTTVGLTLTKAYENATTLRLVFSVLDDLRLDGVAVELWPTIQEMGDSLKFAQAYEFNAAYKVLLSFLKDKVRFTNWGRQALDVLHLAAELNDDLLATFAVRAMERQSDQHLINTYWSEEDIKSGRSLPSMLWHPGTWTAEDFVRLPPSYQWALLRSTLPRSMQRDQCGAKAFGTFYCSDQFARFLAQYRGECDKVYEPSFVSRTNVVTAVTGER